MQCIKIIKIDNVTNSFAYKTMVSNLIAIQLFAFFAAKWFI